MITTAYIGTSDIAALTVRFPSKVEILKFGEDDTYSAHFMTLDENIPHRYHKVMSGKHWCKIYDDGGC